MDANYRDKFIRCYLTSSGYDHDGNPFEIERDPVDVTEAVLALSANDISVLLNEWEEEEITFMAQFYPGFDPFSGTHWTNLRKAILQFFDVEEKSEISEALVEAARQQKGLVPGQYALVVGRRLEVVRNGDYLLEGWVVARRHHQGLACVDLVVEHNHCRRCYNFPESSLIARPDRFKISPVVVAEENLQDKVSKAIRHSIDETVEGLTFQPDAFLAGKAPEILSGLLNDLITDYRDSLRDIIKELLAHGADPECPDPTYLSPLEHPHLIPEIRTLFERVILDRQACQDGEDHDDFPSAF